MGGPSWTGADLKAAIKRDLEPDSFVRQLILGDGQIIDVNKTLEDLGLISGFAVTAAIGREVRILLLDGSEIKLKAEGTIGSLKRTLAGDRRVCEKPGDKKTFGLLHEGCAVDDQMQVADVCSGVLILQVLHAHYDMQAFYCASLRAKRTEAPPPPPLNRFRPGSWPRFNNHCMECRKPLHWVEGDTTGGRRECVGTFFCQSCMLTFHVREMND